MQVRFWGTRGSIPSPGEETLRYGGNTPCMEVRTQQGQVLIFDCGTGARKLGLELAKAGPLRAHLLVSHTHADHIQGLPFFVPVFMPGSHLTIYGPSGLDRSFPSAVGGQMDYAYFPVPMAHLPSQVEFVELGEGKFTVGDAQFQTQYLNHTAPCVGYRVEAGGVTLAYATDHEPHAFPHLRGGSVAGVPVADDFVHAGDRRHIEFVRGVDLLIHDSQYCTEEFPLKAGWGHSPVEYVVDVALAAGVGTLVLYHHDPTRTDEQIEALLQRCRDRVSRAGGSLEVVAASERTQLALQPRGTSDRLDVSPQVPSIPAGARILVVDDEDMVAMVLQDVLVEDGYDVTRVGNGLEALETARRETFDLVLLDVQMPGMNGFEVCGALRDLATYSEIPIVMLTARGDRTDVSAGFAQGVTDYMTKPFAVPQLRARVRSWLARAAAQAAPLA